MYALRIALSIYITLYALSLSTLLSYNNSLLYIIYISKKRDKQNINMSSPLLCHSVYKEVTTKVQISKELLIWLLCNSEDYETGIKKYLDEVEVGEIKK